MKKVISIIKKVLKIIFVVALIAIGIFAFIFFRQSQNAEAETGQLETEEINYGSLTAAIGATGTVYSRQSAVIAWDASGVVGEVDVSAGDKVSDGQVLAELDQDSLPQNVVQTQADLINYQNQIDDIYEDAVVDEYAVAQKQYDIYTAQQELDDLQKDREKMDWQRCHESTVDTLYADYLLAKDNYQRTLDDYTGNYSWKGEEDLSRAAAKSNLSAAESEYYQCLASWNYCKNKADESEVSDIEADIQMREADIKEYERQLEELKNVKPDLDEIALLEAQIEAAEMTFGLATLESPIGGTITEVLVQEGDIISPGTNAFRIDDISQLLVEVKISEVDINQIKVGHIATLIFDAVYTDEYHGIVSEISSVGESDQGVVEFTVTISLTDASEDIKPGMTATVSIEVDPCIEQARCRGYYVNGSNLAGYQG